MSNIQIINDENFEKFVEENKEKFILLKFFADWCAPCKVFAKTYEEFAQEVQKNEALSQKTVLVEVDIDNSPQIANKFEIRSIPSIALIHLGKTLDIKVGSMTLEALQEWLENKINS